MDANSFVFGFALALLSALSAVTFIVDYRRVVSEIAVMTIILFNLAIFFAILLGAL